MKVDIYIRESDSSDTNFIINSWIKSYRVVMEDVEAPIYYKNQEKLIRRLMDKSKCYMAVNPHDLYQIYGYIMFDNLDEIGILHYIYVKNPYRRFGIGGDLFNMIDFDKKYPCIATHNTRYLGHVKNKWNITYNPYFLIGDVYAN